MEFSLENARDGLTYGFGKVVELGGYGYHKVVETGGALYNNMHFDSVDGVRGIVLLVGALAYTGYQVSKMLSLKKTFKKVITDPVAAWSGKVTGKQRRSYRKNMKKTIPIVAVMNDQDGVGKSTITANMAAYFDKLGYNVLILDYDNKESLPHILPLKDGHHYSSELILKSNISKKASFRDIPEPDALGAGFNHSWLYSSGKDLRKFEKELEYSWFMGKEKRDVRFNLHNYLSLPDIQKQYHIILIDAPAGMSAINANILCAATHLLVPTVLDKVSVSHTVDTLQDYQNFREKLGLAFNFLGVLPSRLSTSMGAGKLAPLQSQAMDMLTDSLEAGCKKLINPVTRKKEKMAVLKSWIYQYVAFQGSNAKLAYHDDDANIQSLVTALGSEVYGKLNLEDNQNISDKEKKDRTHYTVPLYVEGQKIALVPIQRAA